MQQSATAPTTEFDRSIALAASEGTEGHRADGTLLAESSHTRLTTT